MEASCHLRIFMFFRDHDSAIGVSGKTTGQCLPSLLLRRNRKKQGREKGNREEEGAGAHLCS